MKSYLKLSIYSFFLSKLDTKHSFALAECLNFIESYKDECGYGLLVDQGAENIVLSCVNFNVVCGYKRICFFAGPEWKKDSPSRY